MATRVVRKDLHGRDVTIPVWCLDSQAIIRDHGDLTAEEQIARLLADDERVEGADGLRAVLRAGVHVGYIEVAELQVDGINEPRATSATVSHS